MGDTTTYELPYPDASDSPNGPAQIKALAEAVETELERVDETLDDHDAQIVRLDGNQPLIGTETVSFTTNTGHTVNVSFGVTLAAAPDIVIPVISSGGGSSASWTARTDNYTTIGFRLILSGPSQAWSNVPVHWAAFGPITPADES